MSNDIRHWMHLTESLNEAVRPADLYHGTSVTSLLEIIREDRIRAENNGISLTRDLKVASKFANGKAEVVLEDYPEDARPPAAYVEYVHSRMFDENGDVAHINKRNGAVIVLDQDLLKKRYKIEPYSDDETNGKWEMEEKVRRTIKPVKPLIKKILIVDGFGAICRALRWGDKHLGIAPQPEYFEAIKFVQDMAEIRPVF